MADGVAHRLLRDAKQVRGDRVVMDKDGVVAPEQAGHMEHVAHLASELFQGGGEAVALQRHRLKAAREVSRLGDRVVHHTADLFHARGLRSRPG